MFETRIIKDGKIEIHSNGTVYRIMPNGEKRLSALCSAGRNREYQMISLSENGKQMHFYVHRLVAETFLPNPDNKPVVLHKNGDPSDNRVENLEWADSKEQAARIIKKKQKPCLTCGALTCAEDQRCTKCKEKEKRADKSENRLREEQEKIKDQFSGIDVSILSRRELEAVQFRMKYMTYGQIAHEMNCTRQHVDQLLRRALNKKLMGPKPRASQKRKRTALQNELNRIQCKKACIENKIADLQEEIVYYERRIVIVMDQIAEMSAGAGTPSGQ